MGAISGDCLPQLPRRPGHHAVARLSKVVVVGRRLRRREHERAVVVHVVEVVADPSADVGRPERLVGFGPLGDDCEGLTVGVLAEDVEDLALVLEVGIEAGPRDAARFGDRVDRRARIAAFQKETTTGVQDRRAGALTAGGVQLPFGGRSRGHRHAATLYDSIVNCNHRSSNASYRTASARLDTTVKFSQALKRPYVESREA